MSESYVKPGGKITPPWSIRRAKDSDAEALAAIGKETFAATFGRLYPPEDLAAFLADSHSAARAAADIGDPAKAVWLVESGEAVVGYALAGPCKLPHPAVTAACGELQRLYLRSDWQGRGVGSGLLAEALAWLGKDGPRRLWIGVWSENHGAQRLYARHGFVVVGSYGFMVGRTRDHELIMRRD
jgi:ribosomal protein S18 acetylase RimI-like enzyme